MPRSRCRCTLYAFAPLKLSHSRVVAALFNVSLCTRVFTKFYVGRESLSRCRCTFVPRLILCLVLRGFMFVGASLSRCRSTFCSAARIAPCFTRFHACEGVTLALSLHFCCPAGRIGCHARVFARFALRIPLRARFESVSRSRFRWRSGRTGRRARVFARFAVPPKSEHLQNELGSFPIVFDITE